MTSNDKILVGKIVGAQGMKGELRVQTFTENPKDLEKFKNLNLKFVRSASQTVAVYRLDGINDRTAAEKACGTEFFITRDELPKLKNGEHYILDLIGMKIAGTDRTVFYVHNFGAGDILELDNGDMISFNGATINYDKREISI